MRTRLVCDASAEEGINLQAADVMIHLELPWDVFRLEQRIGRSDRFSEAHTGPVESQIVMYGDQPYAREWFAFAPTYAGFRPIRVVAPHVLADAVSALVGDVLTGGPVIIDQQFDERRAELTAEAQRIAAHDALDAVSEGHGRSTNGFYSPTPTSPSAPPSRCGSPELGARSGTLGPGH